MKRDLLSQAIESLRPILAASQSTKQSIHSLWAAAKAARRLGSSDQVSAAFMALAVEANLIDAQGRWTGTDVREGLRRRGAEDIGHVVVWALRGQNPFENGPLS